MPNLKIENSLSAEILNDKDRTNLIYDFLENTDIWHNLCRQSVLGKKGEEKPFDKNHKWYPYEKVTFTFLLYYSFKGISVLETNNLFLKSHSLYEEMLKNDGLIKNKKEMVDDFQFGMFVRSIFSRITKEKDTWYKVKDQYKSFCFQNELKNDLSTNTVKENKKLKL